MNHNLQHKTGQEQTAAQQNSSQQQTALEFSTAEEALRHDADQIVLPPALAERLKKSIAQEPPKENVPWWKKLFGG
jgi:anti-sigma28 factor (negative regulator of flagellin synthesis)